MVGRKHLWKYWWEPSFQAQASDIVKEINETKDDLADEDPIIIDDDEDDDDQGDDQSDDQGDDEDDDEEEPKKKTATDIHKEVKELTLEGQITEARLVLGESLEKGYGGVRLSSWSAILPLMENQMASTTKKLWSRQELGDLVKTTKIAIEEEKDFTTTTEQAKVEEIKQETEDMSIELPDMPLEDLELEEDLQEDISVKDESGGSVIYGIIGAGQAGGRIAESFYGLGYKKVLAVNTAEHDLDGLKVIPDEQKVLMSTGVSSGAGKDMRKGVAAAEKHEQEIYERMQKVFGNVDRILICMGAGGGSGAGACLTLVDTAKRFLTYLGVEKANDKVGVFMSLPYSGETASPDVADNAHLISTKLCELADKGEISPLIMFDNDKIWKMYPKLSVKQFWPTVNSTVTSLFHMFNVLSTQTGISSFDPADYNRTLSAGGCMIMGFTTLKKYTDGTDVSRAIRMNLEKGLLCDGFDISSAKAAACIATASESILDETPGLMHSLETGFDTLANVTGNAIVFRGIYEVAKDKLVVYTMITGLKEPTKRLDELKKFQKDTATKKTKLFD